jgi:parvulin-like peptidyl-prolyl isomerase
MKIRLLVAPLILALVATLAACGGGSQSVPANAVAVVDGTPITTAQFNLLFANAVAVAKLQGQPPPTVGTPQYTTTRDQIVAYLVRFAELKQQAPKEGVSVSQSDVTKFLTNLAKTKFDGSMQKLTAARKAQGLSMDTARLEVEDNLLQQKIEAKVTASVKATAKQEHDYYNSNIGQYTTRSVEHILVKKKSLADRLEQQLKNGASFAKLAKQYSKDPGSAAMGGKYTATKGKEVPAYDDVAFSLHTGELSPPVDATSTANGGYGWFIIKALAPVKIASFSDVEASIKQSLLQAPRDQLFQQWISDLEKKYQGKVSYQSGYAPPTTTALSTTPTG